MEPRHICVFLDFIFFYFSISQYFVIDRWFGSTICFFLFPNSWMSMDIHSKVHFKRFSSLLKAHWWPRTLPDIFVHYPNTVSRSHDDICAAYHFSPSHHHWAFIRLDKKDIFQGSETMRSNRLGLSLKSSRKVLSCSSRYMNWNNIPE